MHISDRASAQREATSFAYFTFAWLAAYNRNDNIALPLEGDDEVLARFAVRHCISLGNSKPEDFDKVVAAVSRSIELRYRHTHENIRGFAMDEVRSLIAEELEAR